MSHQMTVLALARSTGGFYHGALLAGLTREVAAAGGRVVVVQTVDPDDRPDELDRVPGYDLPVAWDEIDGVVSVSLAAGGPYLARIRAAGKPVVLASSRVEGFDAPVALPNNHGGTFAAVEHLIAHGHTRIGFAGALTQSDMQERYAAYLEALAIHELESGPHLLFEAGDPTETGGVTAARAFLDAPIRPTALMVATDRTALRMLTTLADAGVAVPQDVAVVAFDNTEAGAFSTPTLSSVSQRFDEVGALAGRLVVSCIHGEPVPPITFSSPAVVVAARGSCGCVTDLLGSADHRSVRGTDTTRHTLRDELKDLLRGTLLAGREAIGVAPTDDRVRQAVDDVERVLAQDRDPSTEQVQRLLTTLHRLAPRPEMLHPVANAINEYVQVLTSWEARPGSRAACGAAQVTAGLWQMQAGAYLRRSQSLESALEEQFAVDAALLDARGTDPRRLRWVAATHVRSAVLGLWDGAADGHVRIVGQFDASGDAADLVGSELPVESFPPTAMIAKAASRHREVCLVVPVRSRDRDWGLLAVIAEIDTSSARDTYRHWATLLCSAFEDEELHAAVRMSEERYAFAAKAANDGLWEWDLTTDLLFLSARCRDLLGLPEGGQEDDLTDSDAWRCVHPADEPTVREAMAKAMSWRDQPIEAEFRVALAGGCERWVLLRGLGVTSGAGPVDRLVGSLSDINPRKELEAQLRQGALYDELTGLPNRRLFLDRLALAVAQPRRRRGANFAVIFLDLDGFKLVNDSLGHLMGDELLTVVADRLRADLRSVDTAARFGGDEFAVLLVDPVPDEVLVIARRIHEGIAAPVVLGGHEVSVTASIGIATSESGYTCAEDVLRDADIAMYHAKEAERGTARVFDASMHARATGRLRERGELRTALAEHQFVVHYQPIVALDGSALARFEALVRWQHPDRGLLPPIEFLPVMAENHTIVALGSWIIDEVCRQIAEWRLAYGGDIAVAVNLSHREFWAADLLETVAGALARHAVPPRCLVLEITESVVMTEPDAARELMAALHATGVQLHIDDFGTGQSSLHALRTLPVDALKIDGSFIRELHVSQQTAELVRIILEIGTALGLDVVAECVETRQQADHLRALGCANAQGWLYAKALPGGAAGALLGTTLDATDDPVPAPSAVLVGTCER
ncbi:EAL domain-containing protein [Cellulomonas sp. KRMCY2]|uniref:EAL domain-containing protein n=1 Tax=Cellulomonas sp. KRMCY2 TaxID=1304865 RepID=UPI00045E7976|nr:EAL domain-containing protein [Cellulomonas sp. KRMCY2]